MQPQTPLAIALAVAIALLLYPSLVVTSRVVSAFGTSAYRANVAQANARARAEMTR